MAEAPETNFDVYLGRSHPTEQDRLSLCQMFMNNVKLTDLERVAFVAICKSGQDGIWLRDLEEKIPFKPTFLGGPKYGYERRMKTWEIVQSLEDKVYEYFEGEAAKNLVPHYDLNLSIGAEYSGISVYARRRPACIEELDAVLAYGKHARKVPDDGRYVYDLAISYASEDQDYAYRIAEALKIRDFSVFYDKYEQARLWGNNLYTHLSKVYKDKARFCLVLISKSYKEKLWTMHELYAAQARAFAESEAYILPLRLDDTQIDGILPTTANISISTHKFEAIIELLQQKLQG